MYNLRTCVVGVEGRLELAMLARQLSNLGIEFYGLHDLRWLSEGECDIFVEGGD